MTLNADTDLINLCDLIEFDCNFYESNNLDLKNFSQDQLYAHYASFGYWEGRPSSPYCLRDEFINLIPEKVLELGPFYTPIITGKNAKYFDVLSKQELLERAREIGMPVDKVPEINYVSKNGDLGVIDEKFEAIVSSHNIEHQTDLITHLRNISGLLENGGKYFLIVPNSKYCFDADLPETKISEIFNAFYEKRKFHTVGSVIEHSGMHIHNDVEKHWEISQQVTDKSKVRKLNPARIANAIQLYDNSNGNYIDVHAWQFTPVSFSNIMNCLIDMEVIPFSNIKVFGPVHNRDEFTAILEK